MYGLANERRESKGKKTEHNDSTAMTTTRDDDEAEGRKREGGMHRRKTHPGPFLFPLVPHSLRPSGPGTGQATWQAGTEAHQIMERIQQHSVDPDGMPGGPSRISISRPEQHGPWPSKRDLGRGGVLVRHTSFLAGWVRRRMPKIANNLCNNLGEGDGVNPSGWANEAFPHPAVHSLRRRHTFPTTKQGRYRSESMGALGARESRRGVFEFRTIDPTALH
jgi:hypothetical protein